MKKQIKDFVYKLFCLLPIQKNKILFFSYYGTQYGCSPKYLSKYISENDKKWKQVWAISNSLVIDNKDIKKVKYYTISFLYELATSAVLVTNYRLGNEIVKRKGQVYIQTWHSSLRLKKIEADAEKDLPMTYIKQAKRDSKYIDYLLSGCSESTNIFKRSFWYDGEILDVGTPRIDPIINQKKNDLREIKIKLGIEDSIKIVLYAPTFRKNKDYSCYIKDFEGITKALHSKFGGEWKVLIRLHPHLINQSSEIIKQPNVLDVTKYQDIQELLIVADFVITDYSSLMFDYLFSKKPLLLYVPDLEEYLQQDRELYYDVEDLPFLKVYNSNQIENIINTFDERKYLENVDNYINTIGSFEDGTASSKILEILNKN